MIVKSQMGELSTFITSNSNIWAQRTPSKRISLFLKSCLYPNSSKLDFNIWRNVCSNTLTMVVDISKIKMNTL